MAQKESQLEPYLYAIRDCYITHPVLFNVDHYRPKGSDQTFIESQWITAEPLDDTYIKTGTLASYSHAQETTHSGLASIVEHDTVWIQKYSPSGKLKVIFRMTAEGAVVELYKAGVLQHRKVVPPTTHLTLVRSQVLVSEFIHFSEDESRFLYMADDPIPLISVYKLKDIGINRFKYRDSLGDRLSSHSNPTIFVYDIESKETIRVNKPKETSDNRTIYLQPRFADAQGHSIICTSLNMVEVTDQSYFMNCPKKLQYLTGLSVDKAVPGILGAKVFLPTVVELSKDLSEEVGFFPKPSPDFTKISYMFVEKNPTAAINYCGLRVFDKETFKTETIVEEYDEEKDGFAGICGIHATLARYDWIDQKTIGFNSYYHQTSYVYQVDVESKKVTKISQRKYLQTESCTFMATLSPGVVLCKRDTLYRNGLLFVLARQADGSFKEVNFSEDHVIPEGHAAIEEETLTVDGIEATLYGFESSVPEHKKPLIVYIHGGPHSVWPNVYNPFLRVFLENSHRVLNVNYTGSIGRGKKFAEGILGKAGTFEVEQVVSFIQHLIENKRCHADHIKILSGSYGGLMTVQMLKKYPDLIKCASLFNPVVNGFTMWQGSTLPTWVYSEILGHNDIPPNFAEYLTDEEVIKVRDSSPMVGEFKFKTELLLFTGLKDEVVPPLSTRSFFKKCRATGLKVQLFEYPAEEHLITMVGPNFDYCIKSAMLFSGLFPFEFPKST